MTPKKFCPRASISTRDQSDSAAPSPALGPRVATGCGYYDQAHFINDFREFCGLTPSDYLNERPGIPEFCADSLLGKILPNTLRRCFASEWKNES